MIKRKLIVLSFIFFSTISINQCYAVTVGDSYGGGTVFCVSKTPDITQCLTEGSGDYGLIMANEDQVNFDSNPQHGVTWFTEDKVVVSRFSNPYATIDTRIPGARSLDNGAANTAAIIRAKYKDNPSNNAAWLCHNYRDPIEGHTDWYLPSKNELNKMYIYAEAHDLIGNGCFGSKPSGIQCLVGGYMDQYRIYWSSSEEPSSSRVAWVQSISNGGQSVSDKILHHHGVRAIRAFDASKDEKANSLSSSSNQNNLNQIKVENNNRIAPSSSRKISTVHTEISSTNIPGLLSDIPEFFICPITQEIMVDPVIAADGHTYERTAIEGWFRMGKRTSPMTNLLLDHTTLTPNIALRQAIEMFMKTKSEIKRNDYSR